MNGFRVFACFGLLLAAFSSQAQGFGTIEAFVPQQPRALERVSARVRFPDSCPYFVGVRTVAGTTRIVTEAPPPDLFCGQAITQFDVPLGAFAAGTQPVELGHFSESTWVVDQRVELVIAGAANGLADEAAELTGLYWNPGSPGWGLQTLVYPDGDTLALQAFFYTYDADANPVWYVLVTRRDETGDFVGTVNRSVGVPFGLGSTGVTLLPIGDARISFIDGGFGVLRTTVGGRTIDYAFERFEY